RCPPAPAAATRALRQRLPQHAAAACRSRAPQGVARRSAAWTGGLGGGTVERQGGPRGEGLGATRLKTLRGGPHHPDMRGVPELFWTARWRGGWRHNEARDLLRVADDKRLKLVTSGYPIRRQRQVFLYRQFDGFDKA